MIVGFARVMRGDDRRLEWKLADAPSILQPGMDGKAGVRDGQLLANYAQ
jgi:hypothetical protein